MSTQLNRARTLGPIAGRERSHAELDAATEFDAGDPIELAGEYAELRAQHPPLRVRGGCCGTNHVDAEAIGRACLTGTAS